MQQQQIIIADICASLYGEPAENVYLFVHGQGGSKEEAAAFAKLVCQSGWQVLSFDLPEHGGRAGDGSALLPWIVAPELQSIWDYLASNWAQVALRANSIGAWFSMLALSDRPLTKSLFVSPILDMEHLIRRMMQWAQVTPQELETKRLIPTNFGQTLNWNYFCYAQEHPVVRWDSDTRILYGSGDNLTEREIVNAFTARHHCALTVLENGEHWFHTVEQLSVLSCWEEQNA